MTDEQAKINDAFEKFFPSIFSEARRQIAKFYGEEIAAQVEKIYKAAVAAPIDWRVETMESALDSMHDFLNREYSWLSLRSRMKINHAFIMEWK